MHNNAKLVSILYFLFIAALFTSCNSSQNSKQQLFYAENEQYEYSGRFQEKPEGIALINSGASVKAGVIGDSAIIHLESSNAQHHYASIELNGEYLGRYKVQKDPIQLALPQDQEKNELFIYKDTEASNGSIIFKGISAKKVEKVNQSPKLKIEFIGDSITCGMAADTRKIPCGEGEWFDQHNAYLAYGPRVARALNANFELSCVSGMGMYRNWNDEDQPVMSDVYSNLNLNADSSQKANFQNNPPDIVSIALGTNDLSYGDGEKKRKDFDAKKFTSNYISFVENIYDYYPQTKVVLLSSPMVGEKEREILVASLNEVKDHFKDKNISVFEFDKMEPKGCTSHPNIEDHEEMAKDLIPFFKQILSQYLKQ